MRADYRFRVLWLLLLWLALIGGMLLGLLAGRYFMVRTHYGEALVANRISALLKRPYLLLNNITLPTNDGTCQIDHILVMDTGVFIIETKHYTGWIFGNPAQPYWTQVIYRKKSKFRNPVHQNWGHVKAVEVLFKLPSDAFSSLVVFSGDAEFKTALGPEVVRLPELIARLSADRPVRFDERQMTYIVGRIEMKRLRRSIETDEYHLNFVRRRLQAQGSPTARASTLPLDL